MRGWRALVLLALAGCAAHAPPVAPTPAPSTPDPRSVPVGADRVVFASRDGDLNNGHPTMLDGLLFRPPGGGPFSAVIALHGCAGSYDKDGQLSARDHDWALRLVEQGYVVFLPDSFTARGVSEICTHAQRPIRPEIERARDAYGALVYLQSRPFVHGDRVALLGWSNGAMTVLHAISQLTAARPPSLAHDFRRAVAFYPGCRRVLDEGDWSPVVALSILMGASDDWTEAAPCQELVKRAQAAHQPVDIVLYPGAYHDFDAPDMPVHVRHNISSTKSHTATIGTDPAARADAIGRVTALLKASL